MRPIHLINYQSILFVVNKNNKVIIVFCHRIIDGNQELDDDLAFVNFSLC